MKIKMHVKTLVWFLPIILLSCGNNTKTALIETCIANDTATAAFCIARPNYASPVIYSETDFKGVIRIAKVFANDIKMVTGIEPLVTTSADANNQIIIVGTIGKNKLIDSLANAGKINISIIKDKPESSLIQVVDNPVKGVAKALVIAGADKRGTIYGMFGLSRAMGVSPWYWWADVPVKTKNHVFVKPGIFTDGQPKVKYRGIFINDEAPALSGFVYKKYGEFNSEFYYQVFELILRHKANFLWPAMWGRAFYVNDTLNPVIADEIGVVVSTSHHEPLGRAHVEWQWYGKGAWNYSTNKEVLDQFWEQGMERMKNQENIVTVGMRGDGDEPMSQEANISLLENIVMNQRLIIEKVTNKPASQTPQVWALYKEVQEYYEKGMRVPDDITLLLCDDNWGNARKLPNETELKHPGGYGMYYHFDYVGGPRNYKWLNTNQIPRVWEQMNLTYQHGVDKIWIVNVGDIKPMELPISFFLDYAWNPEQYNAENINNYTTNWIAQQFGQQHAQAISDLINLYERYNNRRKPEMIDTTTYSLVNYREFETVVSDYNILAAKADSINNLIPDNCKDAFFQIVLFPIKASANFNQLYYTTALNHLYYKQQRSATNNMANLVKQLFITDSLLTHQYNNVMANGKWHHMMDQTHIGYTYWQQPEINIIPKTYTNTLPKKADMGIVTEGETEAWPLNKQLKLPAFYQHGIKSFYFEIFNKGTEPFTVNLTVDNNCIKLSPARTITVTQQQRVEVCIDWEKAETCNNNLITIETSDGQLAHIEVIVVKQNITGQNAFIMADGFVSIEAQNYANAYAPNTLKWVTINNLGRTLSGVTLLPSNIEPDNKAFAEYNFITSDTGKMYAHLLFSPTLDFMHIGGIQFMLSVNNSTPVKVNLHTNARSTNWNHWVGQNIIETITPVNIDKPGLQTLKFSPLNKGLVLQKVIIDGGGLKPSYLGPPQSNKISN